MSRRALLSGQVPGRAGFVFRPFPPPARRTALLLGCLLFQPLACPPADAADPEDPPLPLVRLGISITDDEGAPRDARVRVRGSDGRVYPLAADQERLRYFAAGGFCYSRDGFLEIDLPTGWTRVTMGRGFEWNPRDLTFFLAADTTLDFVLSRFVDLRPEGWYCGEMHAHTQHQPIDYEIPPAAALRVVRAEDLAVAHLLDDLYEFTGAPHHLSDEETILYYSTEYRNQTYGHACLPGLRQFSGNWCCENPLPAYPMLYELHALVVPNRGPMITLAHPHSTDDYYQDVGWPGAGLGRELPVMAALGYLGAMEVVAYGNDPWEDWPEWYDLLGSGLSVVPISGTDVRLCSATSPPIGSWRVYARVEPGSPLDYDEWIGAIGAGRTFITNYPLIPRFEVEGRGPGEELEVEGDRLQATVRLRLLCALGLRRAALVAEGEEALVLDFLHFPPPTEVDTTFAIDLPTPSWIAVMVEGFGGHPHAAVGDPKAHSNAVRITRQGDPIRRTAPSGRWLDNLEMLTGLVLDRGGWQQAWHRDTVVARISRAADVYARAFVEPPGAFDLLSPALGETLDDGTARFEWTESVDPEEGDRVGYYVMIAGDSLMADAMVFYSQANSLPLPPPLGPGTWWWAVDAADRRGNRTRSTPPLSWFQILDGNSTVQGLAVEPAILRRVAPIPSVGPVRLEGFAEPVSVYDIRGRLVARWGAEVRPEGEAAVWDATIAGARAPAGLYWAKGGGDERPVRLVLIR